MLHDKRLKSWIDVNRLTYVHINKTLWWQLQITRETDSQPSTDPELITHNVPTYLNLARKNTSIVRQRMLAHGENTMNAPLKKPVEPNQSLQDPRNRTVSTINSTDALAMIEHGSELTLNITTPSWQQVFGHH